MTTAMNDAAGGGARMETDQAAADLTKKPKKRKGNFDPGVGGGVDRDKIPAEDFAGPGRSFPIVTQDDISDAASLAHHADDPAAVRARIRSIARRKFGDNVDLPPSLAEKLMSTWAQQSTGTGYLADGHAADSPGNSPGPSGPLRHPATGAYTSARSMLAAGHYSATTPPVGDPSDPGRVDVHHWNQPPSLMPRQLASLTTTEGQGPIASSIAMHCGMASLQQLDMASAASPFLMAQLGDRAPSGNPALAAVAPARPPAPTPARNPGAAYLPYDRDANSLKSAAPGSRFTTPLPPGLGG